MDFLCAYLHTTTMAARKPAEGIKGSATRAAIIDAFIRLAHDRRYESIKTNELVEAAQIGRSTFYEHFRSKDEVMLEALHPVVLALATSASGRAARSYVLTMVRHLWERRSLIRPLLESQAQPKIQRQLAKLVEPHTIRSGLSLAQSHSAAMGIAAAQLTMLRCWLAGEASLTGEEVTDQLIACSNIHVLRTGAIYQQN